MSSIKHIWSLLHFLLNLKSGLRDHKKFGSVLLKSLLNNVKILLEDQNLD